MRDHITEGDAPFLKAYSGSAGDRIEVDDDVIRNIGNKSNLEQTIGGKPLSTKNVRRCVLKWRALRESNPSLQRERLAS